MPDLKETLDQKIDRRISARPQRRGGWSSFSIFGAIGFGIVVPVALCTYIGVLAGAAMLFILAGVAIGLFNAWHFIRGEAAK